MCPHRDRTGFLSIAQSAFTFRDEPDADAAEDQPGQHPRLGRDIVTATTASSRSARAPPCPGGRYLCVVEHRGGPRSEGSISRARRQRSSVCGVTRNEAHRSFGSGAPQAKWSRLQALGLSHVRDALGILVDFAGLQRGTPFCSVRSLASVRGRLPDQSDGGVECWGGTDVGSAVRLPSPPSRSSS